MTEQREYIIKWIAGDVQTLRPTWTTQECEEWLDSNWKYIVDRSIELGWEVIAELLPTEPWGKDKT